MIEIGDAKVVGLEAVVRGMRNSMNSLGESDSGYSYIPDIHAMIDNKFVHQDSAEHTFLIGRNDYDLMKCLRNDGIYYCKYMQMLSVYVDITAPLYWWSDFDTYKVGTVANSCSTMHKIADKEFTLDDFSYEHLIDSPFVEEEPGKPALLNVPAREMSVILVNVLNAARHNYLKTKDKKYWWQMIQLLPSSYNQHSTVMLNYEVLANMYESYKSHELAEWRVFCHWIKTLPYSELITGELNE